MERYELFHSRIMSYACLLILLEITSGIVCNSSRSIYLVDKEISFFNKLIFLTCIWNSFSLEAGSIGVEATSFSLGEKEYLYTVAAH